MNYFQIKFPLFSNILWKHIRNIYSILLEVIQFYLVFILLFQAFRLLIYFNYSDLFINLHFFRWFCRHVRLQLQRAGLSSIIQIFYNFRDQTAAFLSNFSNVPTLEPAGDIISLKNSKNLLVRAVNRQPLFTARDVS